MDTAAGNPVRMERGLTRRQVLATGGTAALAVLLSGPSAHGSTLLLPSGLKRSTHLGLADRRFGVRRTATAPLSPFTLLAVEDLPRAATLEKYRGAESAFGLTFEGPAGWPQGTYRFANPGMRSQPFFATPLTVAGARQRYEVIVDRLYRPTLSFPAPRPGDARVD